MYEEPDTSRGAERRAAQNPVGILTPAPERPSFTESDHEREGLGADWVTLLWWQAGSSGRITVEGIGKWKISGQMYDIN